VVIQQGLHIAGEICGRSGAQREPGKRDSGNGEGSAP
jgi:hypothetical protein